MSPEAGHAEEDEAKIPAHHAAPGPGTANAFTASGDWTPGPIVPVIAALLRIGNFPIGTGGQAKASTNNVQVPAGFHRPPSSGTFPPLRRLGQHWLFRGAIEVCGS